MTPNNDPTGMLSSLATATPVAPATTTAPETTQVAPVTENSVIEPKTDGMTSVDKPNEIATPKIDPFATSSLPISSELSGLPTSTSTVMKVETPKYDSADEIKLDLEKPQVRTENAFSSSNDEASEITTSKLMLYILIISVLAVAIGAGSVLLYSNYL